MKILKGFEALEYVLKNKDAVLYIWYIIGK